MWDNKINILTISGRLDTTSATEAVDLGSIPRLGQTKDYKNSSS